MPKSLHHWHLEDQLCARLEASGVPYQRELACPVGIVDVLTADTIYEIKDCLDRQGVYRAIGQLLVYSSVFPNRRLVIAAPHKMDRFLWDAVAPLGIQEELVNCAWPPDRRKFAKPRHSSRTQAEQLHIRQFPHLRATTAHGAE